MQVTDSEILNTFHTTSTKEKGFELLVTKYREPLYWQIRRMVNDHNDADDVLQNVFIKVWKYLANFKANSSLHTWLYRIAVNETLTFLNQKKKRAEQAFEGEPAKVNGPLSPDREYTEQEIEDKLKRAIAALPDKQKLVFNLRYYDEMSYDEMSDILDTSVGGLKASYHHAVKKIEQFLKDN